ncbi:TPA: restriction endonuclease subunit S [Streptococcus suis]|nr:restriction endonuclease subunit S [Streptococcus suis]
MTKNEIAAGELPYISSSSVNNGIQEYISSLDKSAIFENCLSIAYNGKESAVFYHPYQAFFSDNVRVVKYKDSSAGKCQYLFTANLFKKVRERFNYGNPMSSSKLRTEKIKLPFIENNLAFSYMENYIKTLEAERIETLEAERIETLEAYLTVTGLKDYHLTKNDEKILDRFAKLSDTESRVEEWGTYSLKALFGSSTRGKRLKSADRKSGVLPFVTAGEDNTGISDFIGNSVQVFSKNSITIDMFGSAKYRGYNFGADDHVAVVHTEHLGRYDAMFLSRCIHHVSNAGQFSYSRNFYAKDADELNIKLPTLNNQPDYDFMSDFIRVIEKLVIKELVEWTDKKIEATREVVNR